MLFKTIFDYLFQGFLTPLWGSILFFKILSLILLITILLLLKFKKKFFLKDKITEHDTKIFNKTNQISDEERLYDFINRLENRVIDLEYIITPKEFIKLSNLESMKYLDKNLNKKNAIFLESLAKLIDFVSAHFMDYQGRENDSRLHFEPDLKHSSHKNKTEYYKIYSELCKILSETKDKYSIYRNAIKKKLFI